MTAPRYTVKLYDLTAPAGVRVKQTIPACDDNEARNILIGHATEHGFTRVQFVDDDGYGDYRATATTPGGRAGRNIGTMTPADPDSGFSTGAALATLAGSIALALAFAALASADLPARLVVGYVAALAAGWKLYRLNREAR